MAELTRPNILFFFTDDQRFDTIHALGNEAIHTPHIDRLVRQGTAFTFAHIMGGTSPAVCMPSRAMLHTGRQLFALQGAGEAIPNEHVLLGEHLQRFGYRTWGAGKWHNGPASYARSFSDGAEIFFGGMDDHWNVPACDFDPTGRYDKASPVVLNPKATNQVTYRLCDHIRPGKHSSELFAEAAIEFLRRYDDEAPFFMYLSFMAPHDPRTMPREFLAMYDPETVELPPNFTGGHPFDNGELKVRDELLEEFPRTAPAIRRHLAEYYAMISHLDAQIGRVMEALEATGHAANTLVVLAGDNGLALGQHGLMGKQNLYDHSLRVPLIMAGPGVPQGMRSDALCYLHDVMPTLCDLVGVPIPETVQGRSLVPAMRQGATIRDTMYFAYKEYQRAVRDRRYKLIEYVVDGRRTTQLFDIEHDPWEQHNLAHEPGMSEHLHRLRRDLIRWRDETEDRATDWGLCFWSGYAE
ncbi:MAG: sulfatase-like hydrolase/transferase [Chloroflexi bacterium]|nr:sulfatase-like hydrolase/transferase [Chloroflexota bacterium]